MAPVPASSVASLVQPLVEPAASVTAYVPHGGLSAPLTPDDRLLVAQLLAADRATHEEAVEALLALVDDPATTGRAHVALVTLCLGADPRPGWLDVYERLAADGRSTSREVAALRLRAAEARTWVPAAHAEARTTLAAEVARREAAGLPVSDDLVWHLGRAHLVLGEVQAAAVLFARRRGDPRFDAAARVAALGLPGAQGDLAARIRGIAAAGYPDLAVRLAARDDPARVDARAWAAHAAVLLGRGRPAEALAAVPAGRPSRGSEGGSEGVAIRTRILLALGLLEDARRAAVGVPEAEARVRAVTLADEDPDLAWTLAPDEPRVARARAADRLRAGRAAEAAAILAPLVAAGPPDADTLAAYAQAALQAGDVPAALAVWRAAVTRAWGPAERTALVLGLTDTLARAAEARKRGGDPRGAVALYQIAVTARPDEPGLWGGLGGALWASDALEHAQAAYTHAAGLVLARVGPAEAAGYLGSAADIAFLRGRHAEALALLGPHLSASPSLAARSALAETALAGAPPPLDRLDLLLRAHPDDAALAGVVARTLTAAGVLEEALRAWKRAVAAEPRDPSARAGLALTLAALGRFDDAFAALDTAGPVGPLDATRAAVHRAHGDALWRVEGRDADALAAYQAALAAAPDVWAWTAIGGLYLSHGQGPAALASFRAARTFDADNALAVAGEARALIASGDLAGAHALAVRTPALQVEVEAAIDAATIDRAAVLLALDEVEAARAVLQPLRARQPSPRGLAALLAAVDLADGDVGLAFAEARNALRADPTDARAASVLVVAAIESGELDLAAALVDGLAEGPGGGGDRFVLELASARILAAQGLVARARGRLEQLAYAPEGATSPDRLALLGGAWLALSDPAAAHVVYARALNLAPDHAASVEGLAAVAVAEGRHRVARTLLTEACVRTGDPFVGAALARLDGGGGTAASVALRESLRGRVSTPLIREPLPLAAGLPSPVLHGASVGSVPTRAASTVTFPTRPAVVSASAGILSRPGAAGTTRLVADAATATVLAPMGPSLHLDASVLVLGLGDGQTEHFGAAGALGIATFPSSRLHLRTALGTTPIGFEAPPAVTWTAALGWRAGHVEIGIDTLRFPVTDSVASWGGALGDEGVWSQALTTAGGVWLEWAREANDLGLRGRIGTVAALGAEATGRRQLDLWAGHRLGAPDRGVRVGLAGTLLGHDTQLDAFRPGGAGAFTPLLYRAGGGRLDGMWRLAGGARLCGGANFGVQHVEGVDSPFFATGTALAAGVEAGGSVRLGRRWTGGVSARWSVVGQDWSEQLGAAWVRWGEGPSAPQLTLPALYGQAVSGLAVGLGGCG